MLGEIYDRDGKPLFCDTAVFVTRRLLPVLAKSAVAGVVVGGVVTLFNYLLEVAGEFAALFAGIARSGVWLSLCYIVLMACVAVFMYFFTRVLPEGRGSGIPRTEASACGKMRLKWWRLCLATVVGSTVSFFAGIPAPPLSLRTLFFLLFALVLAGFTLQVSYLVGSAAVFLPFYRHIVVLS